MVPWYEALTAKSAPRLQVFADHPAVGNIMGWPREVLPVFHQPLCNLPVLAMAHYARCGGDVAA